jgi:hypothetical protein
MYCFSHQVDTTNNHMDNYKAKTTDNLQYLYDFKNGVNIRPALMYLSVQDQMVEDLSKETRSCHLSPYMHQLVLQTLYKAITESKNGDIIHATR